MFRESASISIPQCDPPFSEGSGYSFGGGVVLLDQLFRLEGFWTMAFAGEHRRTQQWVLVLGPFVIVGVCYLLTLPSRRDTGRPVPGSPATIAAVTNHSASVMEHWWRSVSQAATGSRGDSQASATRISTEESARGFTQQLRASATEIREEYGMDFEVLIRAPFVIAGDDSVEGLQWLHENVLQPSQHALEVSYFDNPPTRPIKVILLRSAERWKQLRTRWTGFRPAEYAGFYSQEDRCLAVNLSTGVGSLAHELTHALIHGDFENCPEWLDEGLASLHEESEFNETGTILKGLPNWRSLHWREAAERQTAPTLQQLMNQPFGQSQAPVVEYAQARLFCIYLQQQGLLESFYRKARIANNAADNEAILCQ
ncbi:MAG: hypothetical protein C0478_04780, partial [Planctomyces sp.]|nr:hypothetical protein [Planctomyces sp.]